MAAFVSCCIAAVIPSLAQKMAEPAASTRARGGGLADGVRLGAAVHLQVEGGPPRQSSSFAPPEALPSFFFLKIDSTASAAPRISIFAARSSAHCGAISTP